MAHRLAFYGIQGLDMDALSPRDANALALRPSSVKTVTDSKMQQQPQQRQQQATKTAAQMRAAVKEKEHPPPPPPEIVEPPSSDRPGGAVYTAGKLLGRGGFAVCYNGQLQSTRQRFALKIVKSQMPPKIEQKFQTELQIHSKMRQKNIVQFFRAFAFSGSTFLVLELCPNGSLMDMVKRRKGVTEAEVRFYTVQIAGAIKYMHSKGIIHRDLKMGNIFLDANMNAKIGDFGLAALMVTGRDMQTIRRTTLCGTPNYIAPEILEKGKKGHDHMVDIWSLGVIVFAMLTSKPPFQSTTTDEIYRKARERDYEWPLVDRIISPEAKDLVALMLQDADERPYPDEIVQHPFFISGYVPCEADMSLKLRELPPDRAEFYSGGRMSSARSARTVEGLKALCEECGVGPWTDRQLVHTHVWKEVAAEEKAGLTPAVPLAENVVYRPFDEWLREQKDPESMSRFGRVGMGYNTLPRLQPSAAAAAAAAASAAAATATAAAIASSAALSEEYLTISSSQRGTTGLLRQPPQSFAAQQRALNRPANPPTITAKRTTAEPATLTNTLPSRPKFRDAAPAVYDPEPKYAADPAPVAKERRPPPAASALRVAADPAKPPRKAEDGARPRRADDAAVAARHGRNFTTEVERKPSSDSIKSSKSSSSASSSSAKSVSSSSTPAAVSIFASHEGAADVPGTHPDHILQRLRRLETELDRALNARTMAFVSSRTVTPRHPHMVIKWVDYTNKYGLGYMLSNGTVGCMVKELPTATSTRDGDDDGGGRNVAMCPASCVLVGGADVHLQRRKDPAYADRHQPTPMDRGIRFFEFNGERGLSGAAVSPDAFRVPVNSDDTPGKMKPGRDVFEHRKRERVVVWKRFANYMAAKGRDESIVVEAPDPAADRGADANAELVVLYQGFGDARCWVFGDGHLQFNFPDHTKIALDAAGTWCHFWHLPRDAAESLATSGTMGDAALDKRSALTYPLQTLLNFHTKPNSGRGSSSSSSSAAAAAAASSSSRRRPEIPPELQGIPAVNDFRRKVEFIRDVVREWVANGGLGNCRLDRDVRLRWTGRRELGPLDTYEKHVWVTLGARWGDARVATYVDPRRPHELGPDVDETRKKREEK